MEKGHLLMSAKERARKGVLDEVVLGRTRLTEASVRLGVSYRQAKRLFARYRTEGDAGLVHRGRGRPSARAKPTAMREAGLAHCRGDLQGPGPPLGAGEPEKRVGLVRVGRARPVSQRSNSARLAAVSE